MITSQKFRNELCATLKYAPTAIKTSGDDFFVLSNTFIKGRVENKSERVFDAV